MKKHLTYALTSMVILSAALTRCSGKTKVVVPPADLAQELKEKATTGELSSPAESMIATIYNLDPSSIKAAAAYVGSGATASEVCVVECNDEKAVKDVISAFKDHVSIQSDLYASYNAAEVDKLKKAVTASAGPYAVLCVPDDEAAAKQVLKNTGF